MDSSALVEPARPNRRRLIGAVATLALAGSVAPRALARSTGLAPLDLAYAGFLEIGDTSMPLASARLRFMPKADRYRMSLEVDSVLAQLHYQSEGRIDADGLRPEHYEERREMPFRKTRTRGVRYRFGDASGKTDPGELLVPAGSQDRLSVIAQIAWLARRPRAGLAPGRVFTLPLAGIGSVHQVELAVAKPEPLLIDQQRVDAWRVSRARDDDADDELDVAVWLEAADGRRPLAIRFREGKRALRFVLAKALG